MWKHYSRRKTIGVILVLIMALMGSDLPTVSSTRERNCKEFCGDTLLPYPFYTKSRSCGRDGFKLECYNNSTLKIELGKILYHVTSILPNGIIVDIMNSNCFPNLESFRIDGKHNYAISKDNFIQFSSCKNRTTCKLPDCNLPYANVIQCKVVNPCCFSLVYDKTWEPGVTNFDRFSEWQCSKFISWGFPGGTNYTSITGLKLEWGIAGNCTSFQCDANARCEAARDVKAGVRCTCNVGYEGNGYIEGNGCVKVCTRDGKKLYDKDCVDWIRSNKKILEAELAAAAVLAVGIMVFVALIIWMKRNTPAWKLGWSYKSQWAGLLANLDEKFNTELFSYKTLYQATNGFADSQKCGHGSVYAGCLIDGRHVAVKRMHCCSTSSQQGRLQLLNEISLISSIEHPNLVRLLGCCLELEDPILVYEFVPNGTVAQQLHREHGDSLVLFDWRSRCAIAADAAGALAYLHNNLKAPVYHRNIKSSNILLDSAFECKIGDFGLSRSVIFDGGTPISTTPQETLGYLDPECLQTHHFCDKSDVYSFGVVLFEIITGMKAVDLSRERKDINIATLAVAKIKADSFDDIIDPSLQVTHQPRVRAMVQRVAKLAFKCLEYEKENRPTMREVASELLAIHRENDVEFEGNKSPNKFAF
ncbi:hypothetical protein SUGI_0094600 [Cryptomeria japonica]|uniref:wall-associated receptor kinase-like 14 n=1 Tax=Cryptomeria japonica TaxID=3369 RepID=UPI002408D0CB|nr:wall-associated receptor kinase-like 14 [Cryptomeria japonica]GLJ08726.1 hypothetical protein SUGI_0094600 [Cryptomeria japonica]